VISEDRVVGSILGLALGDALGAPFEFRRAVDVPDPIPALLLPWRGGPPGSTTDDTAMAMNLVRSITDRGGFDADDLVSRHLEWLASDPPDVGTFTARVLRRVPRASEADGPTPGLGARAAEAAQAIWEEHGPEVSAGNGSVMYCAPLGAAYARRPERLHDLAPRLSALTHFDERCKAAVLAVTVTVAALIDGENPREAIGAGLSAVANREGGEELEFLAEAIGRTRPIDGPDRGFCLFAAAAGLQALAEEASFAETLRRVVAMGGDTDTNAAVAGALVGGAVGQAGLPSEWLDVLHDGEAIEVEARRLAEVATSL
jgi:ADP-ribosyl-[dinitrogen reductase] hydrolase